MPTRLYDLSLPECEDLLRASVAARVAFVAPDGPHIVPVNYAVLERSMLVATSPASQLGRFGPRTPLALEIDGFDYDREQGWSVVVRGLSEVVDEELLAEAFGAPCKPRPWALGRRDLYLRIPWEEVSGRRIGAGWSVVGAWAQSRPWFGFEGLIPLGLADRLGQMLPSPRRRPW